MEIKEVIGVLDSLRDGVSDTEDAIDTAIDILVGHEKGDYIFKDDLLEALDKMKERK